MEERHNIFFESITHLLYILLHHTAFILCFIAISDIVESHVGGRVVIGVLYCTWLCWVIGDLFTIKTMIAPELHECATILQDAVLEIVGKEK